ncbi:helix-turn-helix domain-containing protein [Chryseobacterium sp. B21-037]|jgi:hypothetical protein|uniref:helix-turn-helix domain-containing protein n=1 Tax=Chryseobacterium sp. B21-037 TaxID=2926038 RepID=UPI00235960CF|nr:helix-turn-helix domain-containing protein [Chryseobacterium sp. B21-037]MDC8107168.1 helix-turn-helix domain-containing protein [Chryseobacterium sp. B21-037]WBV56361.1 helix-turn-helix domain-containing protein [Chryseobacterium daecheongense]
MEKQQSPNYIRIYRDIIQTKYPEKEEKCSFFLKKAKLTSREVLQLNKIIFEKESFSEIKLSNSRFRSYDQETIWYILDHQKKYRLNNYQLAEHFKVSRNTITSWKKKFFVK